MAIQGRKGETPSELLPSCKGMQVQVLRAFKARLKTLVKAYTEPRTLPLQLAAMKSMLPLLMVGLVVCKAL